MATKRFFPSFGQHSPRGRKFTRRRTVARSAAVEELENRQLLAVVGVPSDQLADSADGYLNRLYADWLSHQAAGSSTPFSQTQPSFFQIRDDSVAVKAYAPGSAVEVAAAFQSLGATSTHASGDHVVAMAPLAQLPAITGVEGLDYLTFAITPIYRAGATTTQGDEALRTDEVRISTPYDGTGISVGVISNSFDCNDTVTSAADDMASGDLPGIVTDLSPAIACPMNADDEGRAMLQVVHDVAPGAQLYFHNGSDAGGIVSEASMRDAIDAMTFNGVDVVVDDVFFRDEPFFQDGIVAQKITQITSGANPITYLSAAGNSGDLSYQATFADSNINAGGDIGNFDSGNEWHDFDPGPGVAALQDITIPLGARVSIVMQHNEPFRDLGGGQRNDFNFVLINPTVLDPGPFDPATSNSSHDGLVSQGNTNRNINDGLGSLGDNPLEVIEFTNDTGNTSFQIGILRSDGTAATNPEIKYVITVIEGDFPSIDTFDTNSSTLVGHANAAGAIAVGAAFYQNTPEFNGANPPQVSESSSKGGTTILRDSSGNPVNQPRQQPVIVGPDGGNNTFFGTDIAGDADAFPNFFGTSAAAAHIAGVVALMLDADDTQTPAENRQILQDTAIDILERVEPISGTVVTPGASAGIDAYSGYGFVDGEAAVRESAGIPSLDLDDATVGNNSTATFTEGAGPVDVAGTVVISDSDDTELESATIVLTNRPDGAAESLSITPAGGVTIGAPYDPVTGTLTLSGPALISDFAATIASLQYNNTSTNPNPADRVITVTINDGPNDVTATATVEIVIINDPPIAVDDTYMIDEDTQLMIAAGLGVLANDSDPEGQALQAMVLTSTTNGTLALQANGSFTYTPSLHFNGQDSFTYTVDDGNGGTDTATVIITVAPVNDQPAATGDNYAGIEDQVLSISAGQGVLVNDLDVDAGDILTAAIATQPANGTVTLNSDGSFDYTPDPDFSGVDTFTYTLSDGNGGTDVGEVTITVGGVNDAPVAAGDAFSTNEDTPLTIAAPGVLVNDSDVEDDPLTASVVSMPSNGTLTLNANGSFTYTPNLNFNGTDTFVYRANDGFVNSNNATVTITVLAVNDPPLAANDDYTATEDTPLTVAAPGVLQNDSDVEMSPLTAAVASGPSNGMLSLNANGSFTYTPNSNFAGADSFTYTLSDGSATDTATVTITVNPVNDAPVAVNDNYSAVEDTPLSVPAPGVLGNDTDVENDSLTATLVSTTTNGVLVFNGNGSFTYTPALDFQGLDSFTYRANDGSADSNLATVVINVQEENDPPVAASDTYSVNEDTTLNIAVPGVLANDTDSEDDTLTAVLVTDVTNGVLTLNANGSFSYTPNANFSGSDSFTYVASDGLSDSNAATVSITVNPVNDPPVAADDSATTNEDTPVTFDPRANDSDVENNPLTITAVTQGANGSVSFTGSSVTYTPAANFSGADSFMYTISDGAGGTDTALVTVTVNAVNDAPVFTSSPVITAQENTLYSYTITTSDVDNLGSDLTIAAPTLPAWLTFADNGNGTATLTGTPGMGDIGTHSVSLTVTDPGGASSPQSFTIEVLPDNVPPTAVDDTMTIEEDDSNITIDVLANDTTAPDMGETLTITGVSGVGLGHNVVIVGSPGSQTLIYTPPANFFGTETFTYTINDGSAPDSNATATVTVIVNEVNDPPTANDDTYFGLGENSVNNVLDVLANDTVAPDQDPSLGEELEIIAWTTPDNGGTVTLDDNGTPDTGDDFFLYSPAAGFRGTETFMYTVSDGRGGTDTATVNLAVFNQPVFQVASTGDVFAIGSEASDRIIFFATLSFNSISVRYNNVVYGPFILQPGSTLNADGRGGSDYIVVASSTTRTANFEGGAGNDYLAGNNGDDTFSGGIGNDVMLAAEGNNLMLGGDGNDRMEGRSGNDTLDGGDGNDRLSSGSGNNTIRGGEGNDYLSGGLGDDLIFGGGGDDVINGGYGNDVIVGGDGSDLLAGHEGQDLLIAGAGSDRVRGNGGDDLILGGSSDYDNNETALMAILAEWSSGGPLETRIANISDGSTTGGNPLSLTEGSIDDGVIDDLTGDSGIDWFLAFGDFVRDQRSEDVADR